MTGLEKRVSALEASAGMQLVEVFGCSMTAADLGRVLEQVQGTRLPVVPFEKDPALLEKKQ